MAKKEDAETFMKRACLEAVRAAKVEENVELDYSDASIQKVEKMLADVHKHYQKTKNEEGLHGIALIFGAYIGEVIRRRGQGGSWARDHKEFGEDSFPFTWKGSDLFPYGWCLKRIFDGKADDVWFKYQALILKSVATKELVFTPKKRR